MSDETALQNLKEALHLLEKAETEIDGDDRLSVANCRRAQGATESAVERLKGERRYE